MADDVLRQILDRLDAGNERIRLEFERNRAFHREVFDRYEKSERRWAEESRRSREESRLSREESRLSREILAEMVDQIRQMRAETRAQTEAIFRMLDWLDGGGGPKPALP